MKNKFKCNSSLLTQWALSLILVIGLFWSTSSKAQESVSAQSPVPIKDLTATEVNDKYHITRHQFQEMQFDKEKAILLDLQEYVILDLINYESWMDLNDPNLIFHTVSEFMDAGLELQLLWLSAPDKYIIKP